MTDLEKCRQALDSGDALAFMVVADARTDEGRHNPELTELAQNIAWERDWATVQLSAILFLTILEQEL